MSRAARGLYTRGPGLVRVLQHYRPYICPFEALIARTPRGASVLDVGCGGGLFLALLMHSGRLGAGLGFDVSEAAIRAAQEMAAGAGFERVRFERRDLEEGWPEGAFDVVSIIDVMHHVPPAAQRDVIRTAASRLKRGGLLIYKDMVRRPLWRAWANRLHDLALARQWIHYAAIEDVERWAIAEGLRQVAAERHDRLWYGHELRVFERDGVMEGERRDG
ncbi:MAG: class I SAM-dependent methyltransferase [Planctomycetota bacterium]|nr:class I SAM-dependent methyltransferase [Planctomycetota bacterium]